MDSHVSDRDDAQSFREVLLRWEELQTEAPKFEGIHRRLVRSPSPMQADRWSLQRCFKLALALTRTQLRVVPRLIFPLSLSIMVIAFLVGRTLTVTKGTGTDNSMFSSVILAGIVLMMTMALSASDPNSVTLTTPIGPQAIVLARVTVVLLIGISCGLLVSSILVTQSYVDSWIQVVTSWLLPLALVAGVTTLITIWVAPWAAVLVGLVLVPMTAPASEVMIFSGFSGLLRDALPPIVLVGLGVTSLVAAIASSGRAVLNTLPAA